MTFFIVGVRGCPDTVQLPLQATSRTTFLAIRDAVATKLSVTPKAVAIFAKGVEVASYTSELGTEFSVNSFITYELRISARNAPESYEDLKPHAIGFVCCCGCNTNLAVNGKYCTLNCGCTLCLDCADKQEGDHGGAILCPYHQVLTSTDARFHAKSLCGNDAFCAEAPLQSRHEGPHDVLDKLLISQQCQFPMTVNGTKTTCSNTQLFRCRCELPPMCASCMKKHLERTAEESDFHGALTESPVPTDELLSRCSNVHHKGSNSALFLSPQSRLLCHLCHDRSMSPVDVEAVEDLSHIKRSTVAVTKEIDELTSSIRRLEDAKAAALTQNDELLKNLSENIKRLDDNRDDYVKDTKGQFDTRISQLQSIIEKLKADRDKGVQAICDTTKLLKEEFEEKVRLQQASIVSYINVTESLLHFEREQLAAVAHTARFAPQIVPAANAVVDFRRRFYAEGPTAITIEQCEATCEPYKPLVRIIATTDLSESTDVRYRSATRAMVRNLRRRNILMNDVCSAETLPGLSLVEVQQAAADEAKAKADADAAAKAKSEQEAAAAAAAKAKTDADAAAAAKSKADAEAAKAKADADAATPK